MRKIILTLILMFLSLKAGVTYGDLVHVSYGDNNGYDAVVQDIRGDRLKVKVTDVQLHGFLVLHLNPSTCSGHEQLATGDRKIIWIPKYCID